MKLFYNFLFSVAWIIDIFDTFGLIVRKILKIHKSQKGDDFTLFDDVKSALDMPTVARGYGLKINRAGMALCPFHAEKTPSAKIYPDGFHCFGCGVHADVIGFTQRLFGLPRPIDAAKKLNEDFLLRLDVCGHKTANEVSEYRKRQREREEYKCWENEAWLTLSSYYKLLREWREAMRAEVERIGEFLLRPDWQNYDRDPRKAQLCGVKAEKEAPFLAARPPSAATIASVDSRRNNRVFARRER